MNSFSLFVMTFFLLSFLVLHFSLTICRGLYFSSEIFFKNLSEIFWKSSWLLRRHHLLWEQGKGRCTTVSVWASADIREATSPRSGPPDGAWLSIACAVLCLRRKTVVATQDKLMESVSCSHLVVGDKKTNDAMAIVQQDAFSNYFVFGGEALYSGVHHRKTVVQPRGERKEAAGLL